MRQLITRIDDDLHARLKSQATREGRSVNALVTEALENVVDQQRSRAGVRQRARASGRLVTPPRPTSVPSQRDVQVATSGSGTAASEALEFDRGQR